MLSEEITTIAQRVLGKDMELLDLRWGEGTNALLLVSDDYGEVEFDITDAGLLNESDFAKSVEGQKRYREETIADWELQRQWGIEVASLVSGETQDGPERKLEWLPKLLLERLENDFHYDAPFLRRFVADPESVDIDALVRELTSLPKKWSND